MANMDVATAIFSQIRYTTKMACAARDFVGDDDRLWFRVSIAPRKFHKIEVVLDPSDTYTVKLYLISNKIGSDYIVEDEREGVYADSLNEVVYRMCNR